MQEKPQLPNFKNSDELKNGVKKIFQMRFAYSKHLPLYPDFMYGKE